MRGPWIRPFGATDEQISERIETLVRFGESYLGEVAHHQMSGVDGRVIDWEIGKKLNGVWLITDAGTEVYRTLRRGYGR